MSRSRYGRYTLQELPPYRYGSNAARVYYTDELPKVLDGLLRFETISGLKRNLEPSRFVLVTALAARLFPGMFK